ncbi:unnamed protein product [Mytilus coruscus]|uniref:C-type lectin domain-containing protein n=1 Tax=Mytilus coruscus TaxID=42192 RepID=A0A6J8EVG3_MYTCO|nr:unnamed protein product [Mytilus coruscus]
MVAKNCIYICILLHFNCIAGIIGKDIFSLNIEAYDDTYEDEKSLHISKVEALIHCSMSCLNQDRCVSCFYNGISNTCILHEDPFTYTIRSQSGAGWKFCITFLPDSGRCKPDFFNYRYLDLCYKFGPAINATDSNIATVCSEPNEDLVRVDSEERQSYIETITTFCNGIGGYLAIIGISEEDELLKSHIATIDPSKDYWIGGSDLATEGVFIWDNTSAAVNLPNSTLFQGWELGQPDNNNENQHCMMLA